MSESRVELAALNGLRFWATLGIVSGHAVESLWIDNSNSFEWLSTYSCSILRRSADDLVSFYFILAGFTIHWGYSSRNLESWDDKTKYWIRRLERFYPDFVLSSLVTFILEAIPLFGCHIYPVLAWIFNFSTFLLLGAWLMFIPGAFYLNGPAWFIVTLVWLWIFYPYLVGTVKTFFQFEGGTSFLLKIFVIWLISLTPWLLLLAFGDFYVGFGFATFRDFTLGVKESPVFRLPEFILGIAVAIRIKQEQEYVSVENKENDKTLDSYTTLTMLFAAAIIGILIFHICGLLYWKPECSCLETTIECYGWYQFVDSRFALVSLLLIYLVASLDATAASPAGSAENNVQARAGQLGISVWTFLSWGPFQEVNKWGLQAFLYQHAADVFLQSMYVDVNWGLVNRCSPQPLTATFAVFYVVSQICGTYAIAWLMHEEGPLGRLVHSFARQLFASLSSRVTTAASAEDKPQRKSTMQYA